MTLKTLTDAIRNRVDEEMEQTVAESIAEHALGFFGFSDRIIDNALEPTDRNLFYQLQDSLDTPLSQSRKYNFHQKWMFQNFSFRDFLLEQQKLDRLGSDKQANPLR